MKVASHQPSFLPWAGFWNKFLESDVFILSAGIDFTRHDDVINRVRLNDAWLTVPVIKGKAPSILDVMVMPAELPRVAKTIRNSFGKKFPYRNRVWRLAEIIESRDWHFLFELNHALLEEVANILGARTVIVLDSTRPTPGVPKTMRLFDRVCAHITPPFQYLAGRGTASYLEQDIFPPGISVLQQRIGGGVSPETILTVLAREEKPADVIRRAAFWEPWLEQGAAT